MKKLILSSKKLQGSLTLTYENGVLKSFVNEFKQPLNAIQEAKIKQLIQFQSEKINTSEYETIGLDWTLEDTSNGAQRVATFCAAYKKKYGNNYLATRKEGGMLKQIPIKNDQDFEKLVNAYLECTEWWASPKSIGCMVSRINELHKWMNTPQKDADSQWHFPDGYSKTREQECKTNEELQAYWKHLRAQGYQKTRMGIVETWKKI